MGSKSNQTAKRAEQLRRTKGIMPKVHKKLAYPKGYTGLSPKAEARKGSK